MPTKANGGNSSGELSYNYYDKNPPSGGRGAFYRLKQVDFDGKATLSHVVYIKGGIVNQLVLEGLFPNPTSQTLNVVVNAPDKQTVQLIITDMAGKALLQRTMWLQEGRNSKVLDVAALAKGTYVVKVLCSPASGGGCEGVVSKFVKE